MTLPGLVPRDRDKARVLANIITGAVLILLDIGLLVVALTLL